MDLLYDNTQLHKFGLQVQQLLGSEAFGFVNINNLKWEMKQNFDYSADEKAEEFGYASFEDMLDSNVLADYVEIDKERIGEGGQMQTRYKAKQDRHTSAVHREQMIFHKDKERKEERRRRQMAQNFDAILCKPSEKFGHISNGGRGSSHCFESQPQQPQNNHHLHRRRQSSPAMEMNGALDSNWYSNDDNNNNEHVDNEREEVSDSGGASAKLAAKDYTNFFGAINKNTTNLDNNTQAKTTTFTAQQPQQPKQKTSTKIGGVTEWSSSSSDEQSTQSYAEEAKQKQQQKLTMKHKFVGISGWSKHEQQQPSRPQQHTQLLLERHVVVPQKSAKLISLSSDEEDDDGHGKAAAPAPPPLARHPSKKTLSMTALKKIIWSEDEDNADESKTPCGKGVGQEGISSKNSQSPTMFAPPLSSTNVAAGTSTTTASTSNYNNNNGGGIGTPNFDCPTVDSNPSRWSADKLCQWLTEARLADCAQRLLNEEVDGASLLLLTPVHYQHLGFKLGPMVKLQQMVEYLRQFTLVDGCCAGQNQ